MDQKYIVALELSGSQVKGATAKINAGAIAPIANPAVEQIVAEDAANCVQYGVVQNLIDAANYTNFVLKKLSNSPELVNGTISGVYVGIGGRSLVSAHTTAQLTFHTEVEITREILDNLAREATKSIPADKKVLKVLPRKFIVDNKAIANPVGTLGSVIRGEFTVVSCNNSNKRNLEMVITDRVKMPVKDFIVTPLAIADMVLGEEEKQLGCMLVDVGAQTTTVSIYKDRALQWLVTLPLGSKNITHDIAMGLSITDEKAELHKINQGDARPKTLDKSESSTINRYVQARAGEIIANIAAQINFAGYKDSDLPGGIILTGRGSKLRNFREYLASHSKLNVRLAAVSEAITVEDSNIIPNDYLSLLAIVNSAASRVDDDGCVIFNTTVEAPVEAAPVFDPFDESGADDDDVNDTKDSKRAKEEAKAAKQRQKEEERQKKEEEKRLRAERKALENQNKRSLIDRIKAGLTNILNDDEDTDNDI